MGKIISLFTSLVMAFSLLGVMPAMSVGAEESLPTDPTEDSSVLEHEHIYTPVLTKEPTYTEQGYTLYECECGDSYKDNYTEIFKLSEPTSFKLALNSPVSVRISWDKSENADGYIIEQYKSGKWTRIARIADNDTTVYSVKKLASGTTYKFRMRAFDIVGGKAYYSDYTSTLTTCTKPATPKAKMALNSSVSVRLSWNKITGAGGYIVEQYKGGKWVRVGKVAGTSTVQYSVKGLASGTTYKFRVKAFKMLGSKAYYSGYSSTVTTCTKPATPKAKMALNSTNSVRLSWNKITGAGGYIIEQYKSGRWTRIAKITSNDTTVYSVKKLASGTTYKFRIKAYKMLGSKAYYSAYSSTVNASTKASAVVTQQQINEFFSQAGFVGNSIGLGLRNYLASCGSGYLGNPKTIVRGCYSLINDTGANGSAYQLSWGGYTGPAKNVIKRTGIKYVFINMGTNDFLESVDNVYKRYVNYLNGIKEVNPDVVIYIEASTPVCTNNQRSGVNNKNMNTLNVKMKSYCNTQSDMYFIDINAPLRDSSGGLAAKYTSDGYVHLSNAAYKVWIDTVVDFVKTQLTNENKARNAVSTYLSNKNDTNLNNAKSCINKLEKSRLKTELSEMLK